VINLLYVVSNLNKVGPTKQLSYIIKYIDKNKFNIFVLTLSNDSTNSMRDYFKNTLNVKVDTLNMSIIKGLLFARHEINNYIQLNTIQLIHSQGLRADFIVNLIKTLPTCSTIRNYPYYDYKMKRGNVFGSIMAYIHISIIAKNQDNFIACSKSVANEFLKNNIQINYIQNGIDTEIYYGITFKDKINQKSLLNISRGSVIFISVGALIYRKNMSTLIKSFNKYSQNKDAILLILGDGIEKDKLELIANNNIYFLGNIPNVIDYLQISDCFISASLAEGLPNTVLEAMSVGLPTILSNIPSHVEIYEKENKYLFNPTNYQQLIKLFYDIEDELNEYALLSKRILKENFDACIMSKKYQDKYIKLLEKATYN
jgi:glycosyltransferase involved in cell wall biosynthesis